MCVAMHVHKKCIYITRRMFNIVGERERPYLLCWVYKDNVKEKLGPRDSCNTYRGVVLIHYS